MLVPAIVPPSTGSPARVSASPREGSFSSWLPAADARDHGPGSQPAEPSQAAKAAPDGKHAEPQGRTLPNGLAGSTAHAPRRGKASTPDNAASQSPASQGPAANPCVQGVTDTRQAAPAEAQADAFTDELSREAEPAGAAQVPQTAADTPSGSGADDIAADPDAASLGKSQPGRPGKPAPAKTGHTAGTPPPGALPGSGPIAAARSDISAAQTPAQSAQPPDMVALGAHSPAGATRQDAAATLASAAARDPAGPSDSAKPVSPATQLGPALASLHSTSDGARHVTVRLDPAELGQLQVRITRAQDGTASVNVAVERPETLRSLQGDLAHLHQALDRAGLPEQRSLTLHLATPEPGLSSGGGGQSGSHAGSQQQHTRARAPAPTGADPPGSAVPLPTQRAPKRWLRAGLNITA